MHIIQIRTGTTVSLYVSFHCTLILTAVIFYQFGKGLGKMTAVIFDRFGRGLGKMTAVIFDRFGREACWAKVL